MQCLKEMNTQIAKELDTLYLDKQFSDYIEKLQENKNEMNEAVFHYNLGTAYLKMKEIPSGRFHLEKAKTFGLIDGRVSRNLEYVRSQLPPSDIDSAHSVFEKNISLLVGLDFQHYLFISLLSLSALLCWWRQFTQRKLVTLVIVFLVSLSFFIPSVLLRNHAAAIVMKETPLREGPSEAFEEAGSIGEGLKIIIGQSDGKWHLIRYPFHLSGWVSANDIKIL